MDTSCDVEGFVTKVKPPAAGAQSGLVQVGFLLKDTLNVYGEGRNRGRILRAQSCYEQQNIYMNSSQAENSDYVQRAACQALRGNMHMNPQSGETVWQRVARTVAELVQSTKRRDPSFGTVNIEIRIDAVTEKRNQGVDGPAGEHGYDRLVERSSMYCDMCRLRLEPKNIVVSTCHHVFHMCCIFHRLENTSNTCPECNFNLAPMGGGRIRFP